MIPRRGHKIVLWEWPRRTARRSSGELNEPRKGFALVAAGIAVLYFGWLFWTTGIVTAGRRGSYVVTLAENPDQFSYAIAAVLITGVGTLVAGVIVLLRR